MSFLMRYPAVDDYGIKKLQEKILQIATYIHEVCMKEHITYFLMGGSALGAIRHSGFIPWDDDLDIFMTPNEYHKFREYFVKYGDKDNFYLQELSEHAGMIASAKLRMNGTTYIEEATKDWHIHHGVFVDIFILHSTAPSSIGRFTQCLAAKYILAKGQSRKEITYTGIKKAIVSLLRILPKDFGINASLKYLYRYNKSSSSFVCHFMGKAFFKKGIYKSEYFCEAKEVPFENVTLCIPSDANAYLQDRFGNYMAMPPKESIKLAQHAWKWDAEKDFSEYTNRNRDFSDECKLV